MNWACDEVHYAIAVGSFSGPARVRERSCDSHGRASTLNRGRIAALSSIRTSGSLMESQRLSRSQGDLVITLGWSRITVGTLLVFALALAWDVQRAPPSFRHEIFAFVRLSHLPARLPVCRPS